MESTGQPGKIHVSEETAKELVAKGRGNWVTRREDRIVAKGKGELTTYWLNVKIGSQAGSSSMGTDLSTSEDGEENEKPSGTESMSRDRVAADRRSPLERFLQSPSFRSTSDDESTWIGSVHV